MPQWGTDSSFILRFLPMYLFRKKRTDLRLSAFGYQQFGLGFE
jgi:hypothetical protein